MAGIGGLFTRLKHSWNAFLSIEQTPTPYPELGPSYSNRPDRTRLRIQNERSIISAIYTRLGIDVAAVDIRHVKTDDNGRYASDFQSSLMNCLTVEANIDQGARAFKQDAAMTLFDKGVVALVPVDTTSDPTNSNAYDVNTLRVAEVIAWYPRHVTVRVYNDRTGMKQDITLAKAFVAIVENPLYAIMNETNSTLQRLIRKLNLLDAIDEQSASGSLDLIIQLPYVIKTESKRAEAEKRRKEIEVQLKGSQYGVAYTDGTEKITQLNRPAENNLMGQIQYLTTMLYGQLGLTDEILNGTADEATMINYFNRSIEPVLTAMTDAIKRTFLSKTARSQGQSIMYFNNPFKLMTASNIAELADKLTRNEILSSNDFRALLGYAPSSDPKANALLNKNLPIAYDEPPVNGQALAKPKPPAKSPFPQVPAVPDESLGVNSQNGTGS
jgi:Phage portal protein